MVTQLETAGPGSKPKQLGPKATLLTTALHCRCASCSAHSDAGSGGLWRRGVGLEDVKGAAWERHSEGMMVTEEEKRTEDRGSWEGDRKG